MVKQFQGGSLRTSAGPIFLIAAILQTACGLDQQILYDRDGFQVGLQHDPTTDVIGLGDIGSGPASPRNDHPYAFDQSELRQLLGSLFVASNEHDAERDRQVEAPLYRPDELNKLIPLMASAFSRASRTDRVFFSLPSTPFSSTDGRTTGTLFVRHRQLHVALNPLSLPTEGDTAHIVGRPITIRTARPVQEAFVEGQEARLWSKSETMHISLNIPEGLPSEVHASQPPEAAEFSTQSRHTEGKSVQTNTQTAQGNSNKALQRQIEDLSAALRETQAKIIGQASELESVKAELKRLQNQIAERAHRPTKSPRHQ